MIDTTCIDGLLFGRALSFLLRRLIFGPFTVTSAAAHAQIKIQVHVHVDGEEVVPVSICCLGVALRLEW